MADPKRGEVLRHRTYWKVPGSDQEHKTAPADARAVQYDEQEYENGETVVRRIDPDLNGWVIDEIAVDDRKSEAWRKQQQDARAEARQDARDETAAKREERLAASAENREKAADRRQDKQFEYQRGRDAAVDRRAAAAERRAASRDEILAEGQRLQNEITSRRLTREQAQAQFDEWYKVNVEIPNERARIDIARTNAQTSQQTAALASRREDRMTTTDQRRQTLDEQKFARDAGQDAIEAVRKSREGQIFAGPEFAGKAANLLSNFGRGEGGTGGTTFTAADFQRQAEPDYNAIAEVAVQRALARIGYQPQATADGMNAMFGVQAQPPPPPPVPAYAPPPAPSPQPMVPASQRLVGRFGQ